MKPKSHILFPALAAGLAITNIQAAPFALGDKIGIDFGPTAPTNFMNQVNSGTGSIAAGSLINTTNVTVDGVAFSWAHNNGLFLNDDANEALTGQPAVFDSSNLTDWYGTSADGGPTGVITLTFTGLNDALTYNLVVGAAFPQDIVNVIWGANSQSATTNAEVGANAFVTLSGLHTDGLGNLVITGTGTAPRADLAVVSALQLTALPGTISFAGVINDDAGSQISQWKTASTPKTLDADGDNVYGTLAHQFYGIEFKGEGTLYQLDSADPQVGPFSDYATVDEPTGNGTTPADVQVKTTSNGGGGVNRVMFTFTALAGSPANVRIGIATDGLDGGGIFASASIGLRKVGGSSVEHTMTSTNDTPDMVFFDVTGITAGDQFQVFADSGINGYATHQFVTWDVIPAPIAGFTDWASANGATDQTPVQDHDNDGVANGIEYFMGQTGSSFTAMPGLDGSNTVTWTMDPAYNGTYEVQTSPDLSTWTNVASKPVPSGGNLSYTLPTGLGKQFVRLLVTPAP